ncbi:LPXTG-motif protein cell wall anchor domain protein [Umbribacter vaginalis]|nr:LPXTG-motif protein cell wall anchor domain protein [Coriobacteriales bacterium DNF00809]
MTKKNFGKHARSTSEQTAHTLRTVSIGAAGALVGASLALGVSPSGTPLAHAETTPATPAQSQAQTPSTHAPRVNNAPSTGVVKQSSTAQNNPLTATQNNPRTASTAGNATQGTDRAATPTPQGNDRAATPAAPQQANNEITLSKETKDTLPNMYAWGSSDNTYIEGGQKQEVKFTLKPADGVAVTKVAIFPNDNIDINGRNAKDFVEYRSDNKDAHQAYSGEYSLVTNADGSAVLTMSPMYRNNNMAAAGYAANRCIYVYGMKDGQEVLLYKTNIARAATLIPPKTTGSIVLRYDQKLEEKTIREKLQKALDAPTAGKDGKSLRDQIADASQAKGVGVRDKDNQKKLDNTPDNPEKKILVTDNQAYDVNQVNSINKVTSKPDAKVITYQTGVVKLKTYLVSDLGYKSDVLPLTIARYDTRIDKPTVEDPTNVSQDVKTDIIKKLAALNHVAQDKVSINDKGEVTINFEGVDAQDAPKIALRDLVLKKLKEGEFAVPANDKAVFVANPLGYSKTELDRIKTAIFEANKDNTELGLTSKDQITLSYLEGDLTATGDSNKGISNGQAENKITVKIKTDKSVAEFTSNVKENKLTKLPDIRKDYDVSWTKAKIDGRDTDEGISWSNDQKTTIIYRYDPTKAEKFDTTKILGLLKATPKDKQAGLRDLTGGEQLSYEGTGNNGRKSHMHYALQNGEPTGELTLGNMSGAYWQGNQEVSNSDVDLGDNLSEAGSYSWDTEAGSVKVAGKKGKIYKARLFVQPYAMTYYKDVYLEQGRNPGNTAKAINIIFVPQTNHKTKDLSDSIGEHKTETVDGKDVPTQSKYYNASADKKEAYEKALDAAKTLYNSVKDTDESKLTEEQKAQIDNATINLNKARKELDGPDTNKDGLNTSIEANGKAAEGTNPASGTQATNQFKNVSDPDFKDANGQPDTKKNEDAKKAKKAYDDALAEANKVSADKNATQKAVDDAKAKLDAARNKLNEFTTNKDELSAAIAKDGKVNTGEAGKTGDEKLKTADPTYQNSTKEERDAYDKAVAEAQKVVADPNASQKEVNEAIKKLKEAKSKLDAKATDKSKLAAAEKQSFDNPDTADQSKQSVFYKNALTKKNNGNEQEKQAAEQAINNYDQALANARTILNNEKATQAQVDEAKKKLEEAENALHENYKSDDNDLTKAIANNVSGYLMPAYFNAFDQAQKDGADSQAAKDFKAYNDAYQKAKALSAKLKETEESKKPKQTEIDAAKTALEDARKVIDKYATDTSKISAALLHSLAITTSPAYKNASANTDPNSDEAKAKKAYDDALKELQKAFNDQMDKDKGADGAEIPESVIPDKDIDMTNADALKKLQQHAKGQPLNRDVTRLLADLNAAVKGLDKFATKTDELIKSINEDATTHPSPAFKNASLPNYQKADGSGPDDTKNAAAKKAVDEYGEALNKAKDLLNDPNATQAQINEAKKNLDEKRKALDAYNTDTTKLKESVKKHGTKADVPAPEEGTLTSDAYRNASDPHFLTPDGKPDEQKNKQATEDKKAYDDALRKAQELLKKAGPDSNTPLDAQPTQTEIDEALKTLDEARKKLEDNYKTVTTKLDEEAKKSTADGATVAEADFEATPEFKNAKAKTSDGNENADVTAYKKALATARKLVSDAKDTTKKNSERPTQQQINEALDALQAAKKQITDNYKTDLGALTAAKDFAGDGFKKTPEYKNAVAKKTAGDQGATNDLGKDGEQTGFDNVLKKVTEKLNNEDWKKKATQKDVSALLKQLQGAQDKIAKNYKTDATTLQNEVGDKTQDGKPVVPPFEASVPYKNALAKSNAGDATATEKIKTYTDKLKAAQDLIDQVNNTDPNADPDKKPTQEQVNNALDELQKAKKDIADAFKTKADALKKETNELKDDGQPKEEKDKFEKSTEYQNALAKTDADSKKDVQTYKDALKKANELLELFGDDGNPKADIPAGKQIPTQQEVDEAQKALKEIKDKILANYKTNPKDLNDEALKSRADDKDKNPNAFEMTPAFRNAQAKGDDAANAKIKNYNDKLKAARKLLEAFDLVNGGVKAKLPDGMDNAPTQQELDAALKALQDAKAAILKTYDTNAQALSDAVNSDFANTKAYQNAIHEYGIDKSFLNKYLVAYQKALATAKEILERHNGNYDPSDKPTQKEVDDALKALRLTMDTLTEKYSTMPSFLDPKTYGNEPAQAHKQLPKTGDALPLYANSAAVLVAIAVLTRTNRRRKQNRS